MNGQPFYALIIPQSAPPPLGIWGGRPPNYVDIGGPGNQPYPGQGLPGNQPYPDQGLPGGRPPHMWGPIFYPDQGLPGNQPYPGQGLPGFQPHPSHPIAPGGQPPRPWGPINYPDQGLPQPGQPPRPWGPINYPDQGLPQPGRPPGMWGPIFYPDQGLPGNQPIAGWGPGFPTNPIVIPPEDIPEGPVDDDKMVIVVYVPGVGYKMVVVPKPEMPPGYNPPTGPSTERPTPVNK